jgi:hypothetical protein
LLEAARARGSAAKGWGGVVHRPLVSESLPCFVASQAALPEALMLEKNSSVPLENIG